MASLLLPTIRLPSGTATATQRQRTVNATGGECTFARPTSCHCNDNAQPTAPPTHRQRDHVRFRFRFRLEGRASNVERRRRASRDERRGTSAESWTVLHSSMISSAGTASSVERPGTGGVKRRAASRKKRRQRRQRRLRLSFDDGRSLLGSCSSVARVEDVECYGDDGARSARRARSTLARPGSPKQRK